MKALACVVVLAMVLAFSWWCHSNVQRQAHALEDSVSAVRQAIEASDWDRAAEEIGHLDALWHSSRRFLSLVARHELYEPVAVLLGELLAVAPQCDDDTAELAAKLQQHLRLMIETESFRWDNVL